MPQLELNSGRVKINEHSLNSPTTPQPLMFYKTKQTLTQNNNIQSGGLASQNEENFYMRKVAVEHKKTRLNTAINKDKPHS